MGYPRQQPRLFDKAPFAVLPLGIRIVIMIMRTILRPPMTRCSTAYMVDSQGFWSYVRDDDRADGEDAFPALPETSSTSSIC